MTKETGWAWTATVVTGVIVVALSVLPTAAEAQEDAARTLSIFLEVGVEQDQGSERRLNEVGPLRERTRFDFAGPLRPDVALGAVAGQDRGLAWGGGILYRGNYILREDDGDGRRELGTLVEWFGLGEFRLLPLGPLMLVVTGRAGLATLFPGDDLRDEMDGLRDQGANLLPGPRIGVFGGPGIGARYRLGDRLALRSDLGLTWHRLWLLSVSDSPSGVDRTRRVHINSRRARLGLGLEVVF